MKKIEIRKKELETKKQAFLHNLHLSLKEVRLLYLYQWQSSTIPQLTSIQIDGHYYSLERIADSDELFDMLMTMTSIQYRNLNNYSYSSNDTVQSYLKSKQFFKREQQLKSGDAL